MRTAGRRHGRAQLHGAAAGADGAGWWEIQFQPLAGTQELLGLLGMIRVLATPAETPLPVAGKADGPARSPGGALLPR